jgi:glycerate 2-kinase
VYAVWVNGLKASDVRPVAEALIGAALRAVDPADAVRRAMPAEVESAPRVVLIAAGKGAVGMAQGAVERLGSRITRGVVVCVPEHERRARSVVEGAEFGSVEVFPADHPLPTERNLRAAKAIADTAAVSNEQDVVLALISGGASAHLCMPVDGVHLDDLRTISEALLRSGAEIAEVNAVRKHVERLKGGGLARLAWPSRMHVLVLSDVLGDPLDTIGSGPTAGDRSSFKDALEVLDRRGLRRVSPAVTAHLVRGTRGEETETLKPGDEVCERVEHRVIASNSGAVEAVVRAALEMGFQVLGVERGVTGEASDVGRALGERVAEIARSRGSGRWCVVMGGETTVRVGQAAGRGGRNQELALAAATRIRGLKRVGVVAFATDGVDGPTDAAGAIATGTTCDAGIAAGQDVVAALDSHDSYTYFGSTDGLIRTGPTGTNVNDIAVGLGL